MKIDKITYQRLFPLGAYVNERIGIEVQIDAEDNPEDVVKEAAKMVAKWHTELNPELYQAGFDPNIYLPKPEKPTEKQLVLDGISQCTTVPELIEYVDKGLDDADIREAYGNKMVELIGTPSH